MRLSNVHVHAAADHVTIKQQMSPLIRMKVFDFLRHACVHVSLSFAGRQASTSQRAGAQTQGPH